jgi:hypothetical protein
MRRTRSLIISVTAVAVCAAVGVAAPSSASAVARTTGTKGTGPGACPPDAAVLGYSDALDKATFDGTEIGGLSDMAFDSTSGDWVSSVDNHGTDPARLWMYSDLADPAIVGDIVLKKPDGTPYDGTNSDNEGLVVLPNGDFAVSSETEPSIRIYDRTGLQLASLPVPARFAVTGTTPAGEATPNATLEGLTITPNGKTIVAAMEGALSGDVATDGDANLHRFLVYGQGAKGVWKLKKEVAYRTNTGNRVPEVTAYSNSSVLVEEAAFTATAGNSVELYAVPGLISAPDVTAIDNLSTAPKRDVAKKSLVANLVKCPTLGAPAKETQANPLLDNMEGMDLTSPNVGGFAGLAMISDDNFSTGQTTRIIRFLVRLPKNGH